MPQKNICSYISTTTKTQLQCKRPSTNDTNYCTQHQQILLANNLNPRLVNSRDIINIIPPKPPKTPKTPKPSKPPTSISKTSIPTSISKTSIPTSTSKTSKTSKLSKLIKRSNDYDDSEDSDNSETSSFYEDLPSVVRL